MVEKIIEFCARNRLLVLIGVGFALLASLVSIKRMKVDAIPDLSDPQSSSSPSGWAAARR